MITINRHTISRENLREFLTLYQETSIHLGRIDKNPLLHTQQESLLQSVHNDVALVSGTVVKNSQTQSLPKIPPLVLKQETNGVHNAALHLTLPSFGQYTTPKEIIAHALELQSQLSSERIISYITSKKVQVNSVRGFPAPQEQMQKILSEMYSHRKVLASYFERMSVSTKAEEFVRTNQRSEALFISLLKEWASVGMVRGYEITTHSIIVRKHLMHTVCKFFKSEWITLFIMLEIERISGKRFDQLLHPSMTTQTRPASFHCSALFYHKSELPCALFNAANAINGYNDSMNVINPLFKYLAIPMVNMMVVIDDSFTDAQIKKLHGKNLFFIHIDRITETLKKVF